MKRYLGELELLALLAASQLADESHGVALRKRIEEQSGRKVSIGSLYATLGRLEEKGLLRSWESDPLPVRGGRSRRHYEMTARGKKALQESVSALGRMMEGADLRPLPGRS